MGVDGVMLTAAEGALTDGALGAVGALPEG
jgi:hypothetical protein